MGLEQEWVWFLSLAPSIWSNFNLWNSENQETFFQERIDRPPGDSIRDLFFHPLSGGNPISPFKGSLNLSPKRSPKELPGKRWLHVLFSIFDFHNSWKKRLSWWWSPQVTEINSRDPKQMLRQHKWDFQGLVLLVSGRVTHLVVTVGKGRIFFVWKEPYEPCAVTSV